MVPAKQRGRIMSKFLKTVLGLLVAAGTGTAVFAKD